MKRLFTIAFCVFMVASVVPATAQQRERNRQGQENNNRQAPRTNEQLSVEERARAMTDRMKEQLGLNDSQYAKILELNLAQAKERGNFGPGAREEWDKLSDAEKAKRREDMRVSREKYESEIKNILTPEQFAKFRETRNNAADRSGGQRPAQRNN